MDNCQHLITGYKATLSPISMLIPYGSKYFGMAFIPEGDLWPVCPNCLREMVLVLQLQGKDLPENPDNWLGGEEMLQVFTCAYVDPHVSDKHWNQISQMRTVRQTENSHCYNEWLIPDNKYKKRKAQSVTLGNDGVVKSYVRALEVRDRSYESDYSSYEDFDENSSFLPSYSPLRFHTRVISIKDQQATPYEQLPWMKAYHFDFENDSLIDKFSEHKGVSRELRDWTYDFLSNRTFFLSHLSNSSYKVTNWKRLNYVCDKDNNLHTLFNGCFSFCDMDEIFTHLDMQLDYAYLDYLGSLAMNTHSFYDREEIGRYPNCDCCDEAMKLLYSFSTSDYYYKDKRSLPGLDWGGGLFTSLQGLFYCSTSRTFKVECIDEWRD